MVQKWNFKTKKYEDYKLPKNATLIEMDLNKVIACASCGEALIYGLSYTSRQIHNHLGLGYCVCGKCYKKEIELDRENYSKEE